MATPPNPQAKIAVLGLQGLMIYPYGGLYDATTVETLQALQMADASVNSTLAEYFGGENPAALGAEEVKRDTDIKFQAVQFTLRALAIVLGGNVLTSNPGIGTNEVQVMANASSERAKYFRLVIFTNVGTGLLRTTYPRVKISGAFTYSQKMDGWVMPEFPCRAFFDATYQRQDGQTGATYEWYYRDGAQGLIS